jgi:hypothetical protein
MHMPPAPVSILFLSEERDARSASVASSEWQNTRQRRAPIRFSAPHRTAPNEPVATIRSRTHQPAYRDPSTQQMAAFTFRCVPFTLMAVWDTGLRTPQVVSTAGRSGLRAPSIVTAQLPRASLSAHDSLFL